MKKLSLPTIIPEQPAFRSFDIENPTWIPRYQRNLPHLRLIGATYFVTFRLADSIPLKILESWSQERDDWLAGYGLTASLKEENLNSWEIIYLAIPFLERRQFEIQQQRRFLIELDKCHGECVLKKFHGIVANAIDHFHGQRVWVGDYVVMPNHVHVLVQPFPGVYLEEWLYSVKRFTSTKIAKIISLKPKAGSSWQLWQTESFDRIVRTRQELLRIRKYIANNPAKLRIGSYSLKQMYWLDEFAAFALEESS